MRRGGAHRHQARVGDGVVGGRALATPGDDPRIVEDAKVFGHVGLTGSEAVDQLADVLFAVIEQCPDDPEPSRVAEDAEAFGDVFEQFGRKCLWHAQHYMTIER